MLRLGALGPEFDELLVDTVRGDVPAAHEQERFIAHFRGLLGAWADDQGKAVR